MCAGSAGQLDVLDGISCMINFDGPRGWRMGWGRGRERLSSDERSGRERELRDEA